MTDKRFGTRVFFGSVVPSNFPNDEDIFQSNSIPDRPELRAQVRYFTVDLKPLKCPSQTLTENDFSTKFFSENRTQNDETQTGFNFSQEPPIKTTSNESYYSCRSNLSIHEAKFEGSNKAPLPSHAECKGNKGIRDDDLLNHITIVNNIFLNNCIDELNQNYKLVNIDLLKPNANRSFEDTNIKESSRPISVLQKTFASEAHSCQAEQDLGVIYVNRSCKNNNSASIPLVRKNNIPAYDLQEDDNWIISDLREVFPPHVNSSFSNDSLVRFKSGEDPISSEENILPICIFQKKEEENLVTHNRKLMQIKWPQTKYAEKAPICFKIRVSLVSANTANCPKTEKQIKTIRGRQNVGKPNPETNFANKCCRDKNTPIQLGNEHNIPAYSLQDDAHWNISDEIFPEPKNGAFFNETLVEFQSERNPVLCEENSPPVCVFPKKDKKSFSTSRLVQIKIPTIKYIEIVPVCNTLWESVVLVKRATGPTEKERKAVHERHQLVLGLELDSSSTTHSKTLSKEAFSKSIRSKISLKNKFFGDGDFSSKGSLQKDIELEDQKETVLQNLDSSYLQVLIRKSLKTILNEPKPFFRLPTETKYNADSYVPTGNYERVNNTCMVSNKSDQRVKSLSLQYNTVSLRSSTVQLYTTENFDDDSFYFEDSLCFPLSKNTTEVTNAELISSQVIKKDQSEFKRKCFEPTSTLSAIQEESSLETLEESSNKALKGHSLKTLKEHISLDSLDENYPETLGSESFQQSFREISPEFIENCQKSAKDVSHINSETCSQNTFEESMNSSENSQAADYCLVDDTGRPIHLFDGQGLPVTDNSGRPLKSTEGNLLMKCDKNGIPVVDLERCEIYDTAGRQPHEEDFDPSQAPKLALAHKLTTSDGKPLLLYDKQGRPLTSVSGTTLVDCKGRTLVHVTSITLGAD